MDRSLSSKLLAEFVGTFALIFVGAGSICLNQFEGVTIGLIGIALAHGLILSVMVSATMNVSGGHINPAVSISAFLTGHLNANDTVGYVLSQLAGGTLAAFSLRLVYPGGIWSSANLGATLINAPNIGFLEMTGQSSELTVIGAIVLEAILTFFLVFVIYGTGISGSAPSVGGFAIGLTIGADILVGGPLTGASMNPARSFGPALAGGYWTAHWVYWVGPLVGGVLAGLSYEKIIGTNETADFTASDTEDDERA